MSQFYLADRFVQELGGTWRFCHVLGRWFEWDGLEWQERDKGKIQCLASEFLTRSIRWPEASRLSMGMREQICTLYTTRAVLELVKCYPDVAATPEELGYALPARTMRGANWRRVKLKP